jgi:hypothetical protein
MGQSDLYDPGEIEAQLRALRPELLSTGNAIYSSARSVFGVTDRSSYDRRPRCSAISLSAPCPAPPSTRNKRLAYPR